MAGKMSLSELDVLGLDDGNPVSPSEDFVAELEPVEGGSFQSPPSTAEGKDEEPCLEEISAAAAFEILDRGKKGFFTAKDVEACCNEASCRVFGASSIYFRVSAYINRAFPKADPGSVTLEDFEDEWNGKSDSAFRTLIYKHKQDSKTAADATARHRPSSESDSIIAPVSAYRNTSDPGSDTSSQDRRRSPPTPRSRHFADAFRFLSTTERNSDQGDVDEASRPKPTKLGSVEFKSREGRKEGVVHEDGMRVIDARGTTYQHATEWVRMAPFYQRFEQPRDSLSEGEHEHKD